MNKPIKQILKFGIIGIVNTLIDFGLFNLLVALTGIHSGWQVGLLNVVAVITAMTNSFLLNRQWTFYDRDRNTGHSLLRFAVVSSIGILINSLAVAGVALFASSLPVSIYIILNVGKIIGALFSSTWNFIAYRNWVFPTTKQALPAVEEEVPVVPGMLSIVIPAYNEASRLPQRLRKLATAVQSYGPTEIVVVDDGSTDNTRELTEAIARDFSFIRCISYVPNLGKGNAVKTGMLEARGEYLIFVDADETFSWGHIEKIMDQLRAGQQIAVGTRISSGSGRVAGESMLRYIMGRTFNLLVQLVILPDCLDSQCGIKGFSRNATRKIFSRQRLQSFAFDVEVLALARSLQYEIVYVPMEAIDSDGSSVNPLLAPFIMARDIIRVKLNFVFKRYNLPGQSMPWFEVSVAFGLFITALVVRLPWLWSVPRYIDELKEVTLANSIYLGQTAPLHNVAHDIGSMHNYLLAGIFKLLGPNIYWPRLYVAITAALTVMLLYYLGEKLFDRWTGILAAGFLLTNGMHILVTHKAWANCTTPFFFMLAMLATVNAEQKKNGKWLVLAGLLWAATLQTHSSVVIYLLVVLVYVFSGYFRRHSEIKAKWYIGAVIAFLLGYSNMIYYNLISVGGSITWAAHKGYALEGHPGIYSFANNLLQMIVELLRSVSSTFGSETYTVHYLMHPAFLFSLIFIIAGGNWAIKRQRYLLVWMILGGLLIMPWINHRYDFFLATRYIMPLILLSLLLMAYGIVCFIKLIIPYISNQKIVTIPAAALLIGLIFCQLPIFYHYCNQVDSTNLSNQPALQIMSAIQKNYKPGQSIVLVDDQLQIENQPIPDLLTISQMNYVVIHTLGNKQQNSNDVNPQWAQAIVKYKSKNIITVMNQSNYLAMRNYLTGTRTYSFASQVLSTNRRSSQRVVYVVEEQSRHQINLSKN
jgi:glycosyltransferase involved in cell wall biosynthesis/putative flippase GtrA